jgi:hypothetical protein
MKTYTLFLFLSFIFMASCHEQETPKVLEKQILQHPRLLYTGQEVQRVELLSTTEPLMGDLQVKLLKEADRLLTVPLQEYELRDVNYTQDILMISREQVYRMITLALAYRQTGDRRYVQKVEEELVNVCNFPDWNPRHYLDVAEMTTAVAIAYDWLYNELSSTTRQLVVSSIKSKAIDLVLKEYETGDNGSWAKRETNWNVVCNTGMVLGALAVAEHYPDETGKIIENAVKYVPNCLKHFAPDGVCYEGPAYWGYTNMFLSLLLKALNDNFGGDFGLSSLEGVDKTVLYCIHSTSPSGKVFNFANSGGTSPDTEPIYFFFSKHFHQPEAAAYYRQLISSQLDKMNPPRCFFLAIPWFDNTSYDTQASLPTLSVYKGINDIVVFNGNKNTPDFIYLTAKGGDPDMAHQQMDVGTFIVETNGIRWSDDLGADNYSLPGFWDYKPGGQRWSYFRNSNFSHNTLSIDGKIQNSDGIGKVVAYDDKAAQPYATIDMSTVYADQAESVHRTFRLLDDANILVTDSVKLLSPTQTVQWSMITNADVTIGNTRPKIAVLNRDGKQFFLEIKSPSSAKFAVKKAKTFTDAEKTVEGYRLLTVSATGQQQQVIEILMSSSKNLTHIADLTIR